MKAIRNLAKDNRNRLVFVLILITLFDDTRFIIMNNSYSYPLIFMFITCLSIVPILVIINVTFMRKKRFKKQYEFIANLRVGSLFLQKFRFAFFEMCSLSKEIFSEGKGA